MSQRSDHKQLENNLNNNATTYQNLQYVTKAKLTGKFTSFTVYISKEKRFKLSSFLRTLILKMQKAEQIKPKVGRIK